jgi:two-component system, response regulator YesN
MSMYNILITDDEQIVIDSLFYIMTNFFSDKVNLFSALSGAESLEIISRENIDIIFMDINMPGLNGLETVKCIKKLKPDSIVIISSAFDKFLYAQEAMNIGVFKYLTKPVNKNIIIQTVKDAIEQIDKKRDEQTNDNELQKKLDSISPIVESDFIYSCIFSNEKKIDLKSYLEYFNIFEKYWCFASIEVPHIDSSNEYSIYLNIRKLLNQQTRCLVGSFILNRLSFFIPLSEVMLSSGNTHVILQQLHSTLCFNISSSIRCGFSSIESNPDKLLDSYKDSLFALNKTPFSGGFLFADSTENTFSNITESSAYIKIISNQLKTGNSTSVQDYTNEFFAFFENNNLSINKAKGFLFELLIDAKNITTEIDNEFSDKDFDNIFQLLSEENSYSNLRVFISKKLIEYSLVIKASKEKKQNPIIQKITDYINNNLSDNLTLDNLAQITNVSSFYLSKLFKEEKNTTLINYISDKRLEKACELLDKTDLSIKEITSKIGYNDQNYFSRIFKNKFGIAPSEYKFSKK